jgi:hypothetical protein
MRYTWLSDAFIRLGYFIILLALVCFTGQQPVRTPDFRNFYGVSWRGTPHDNLAYARQMGYDYVFYQPGMEKDPLSNGLRFYLETPEYMVYNRQVYTKKKFSTAEVSFYTNYCATVDTTSKFPNNLATGWFWNDTTFSAQLNFQSQKVISWSVERILRKADSIQSINPSFAFGGYAWDVPQPTGDFISRPPNAKQVTLKYWTGGDYVVTNKSNVLKYSTYTEGCLAFYKELFQKTKSKYPNAKFLMEPARIYDDWLAYLSNRTDAKDVMPDMLCQEGITTQYLDDKRIVQSAMINKEYLAITTPNVFGEAENRSIAASAALNGAWFNWYGRFGGSGDMPNYQSVKEVPARLLLIRMLANWENMNNTPLSSRKWDGVTYSSDNAFASPDVIAIRQPQSKKLFVVFLKSGASLKIPRDNTLLKVFQTNELFIESTEAMSDVARDRQVVSLVNAKGVGKGYIFQFRNTFDSNSLAP